MVDGKLLIDGSVLCRVPVRQVKKMGADVVVAVDVLGKVTEVEKVSNMVSLIMRIYEIMDCANTVREQRSGRRIVDLWLEPQMEGVSQYKLKYEPSAYDAGYKIGKENAEKIRRLLSE